MYKNCSPVIVLLLGLGNKDQIQIKLYFKRNFPAEEASLITRGSIEIMILV